MLITGQSESLANRGLVLCVYWSYFLFLLALHIGYGIVLGLIVFALSPSCLAALHGGKISSYRILYAIAWCALHADQAQLYERAITVGKPLELVK